MLITMFHHARSQNCKEAGLATTSTSVNSATTVFFNPFSFDIDPMKRLALLNFNGDPDTLYNGFEPQFFDDPKNGTGHLVIGWRKDGYIDVYHQPSLRMFPEKFNIAGKGVANLIATDFTTALFGVETSGLKIHYQFNDLHGRPVELKVDEYNKGRRKPFGLLAPMGDGAESPTAMPLVLMHDFYFVRKKHSDIIISVGGKNNQPDLLPFFMDGKKMTFIRYSPRPLIATFNEAHDGNIEPIKIQTGALFCESGDYTFGMEWQNGRPQIKSLTRKNHIHPLKLAFDPAFPDVKSFNDNNAFRGTFEIQGDASAGIIKGNYEVKATDGKVVITLIPAGGWKPRYTKFSTMMIFNMAKVFKKWPTTYRWNAELVMDDAGTMRLKSDWERTGKILKN